MDFLKAVLPAGRNFKLIETKGVSKFDYNFSSIGSGILFQNRKIDQF
jgi:hypothetical protein